MEHIKDLIKKPDSSYQKFSHQSHVHVSSKLSMQNKRQFL
uniref:Uncharacterized protein n=1 Tax=Rhizophora mucronata TaxID=61149 RepID=A0A2P2KZ83_RHIMU